MKAASMTDTHPLFAGIGGHQSARARTDEWLTPPHVLNALGGSNSFDLDPSAPITRPWPTARRHLTIIDNGLLHSRQGRVWLNPPYSTSVIGQWLGRMAAHGRGVALIFARTETEAFSKFVWGCASAVLFIQGRLTFCTIDGQPARNKDGGLSNGGAPSVLCAYGRADADILAFCGLPGQFIPLRLPRVVAVTALDQTWLEAVGDWLRQQRGPVALADLYRAFARHPKAQANPNYRAKIRQVLQLGAGQRVARGVWRAECGGCAQ
jgi:hypothetical protein